MKVKTYLVTVYDGSSRSREYDHQFMVSFPFNRRGPARFQKDYYNAYDEVRQNDDWSLTDVLEILRSQGWVIKPAKSIEVEY